METVRNPARYNELLKGPKSRPSSGAEANKGTSGLCLVSFGMDLGVRVG